MVVALVKRTILLTSVVVAVTVTVLQFPERDFQRARDAERLVEHTLRVLYASEELFSTMEVAESGQRGYLLTDDDRYLQSYQSALANLRSAKDTLRQLIATDSGQQARLAKLDQLVETRLLELRRIIALQRTEGSTAAAAAVGRSEGSRAMAELRDLLHDTELQESRLLNIHTQAAQKQESHMRTTLRIGGIVLIAALTIVGALSELNIRNRKRAEAVLRSSEERFRALANGIPQLCWMANADGEIFWYNQRWYEFTGAAQQEVGGLGWHTVHHPTFLPLVLEKWKDAIATGEPFEMVFPLRAADGTFSTFLTRVLPVRSPTGTVTRWLGTHTDITRQQVTEDALRENQERFLLAQQIARFGTFEWNLQTGAKQRTSELEGMYGLPPGGFDASQSNWLNLVCDKDRDRVRALVQETISTGAFEAEWQVVWPDGTTRWLFGRAMLFGDGAEHPLRLVGAVVDINARKQAELEVVLINTQLEQRIHDRTVQLEAANTELEAFAYSVSHDLRAPLRGIDGWSLALLEDYDALLDDRGRSYLDRVRSETQRMGSLIDDMLNLSRVTRGNITTDYVDLTTLATGIVAKLRDLWPGRSMEFVIEPNVFAIGDGRLLDLALTNLLANAVKFTGMRDPARIEFGQIKNEDEMAFYVRDNGVGFDMAHAGTLFGAFQRFHKQSEFPGTGVGLATVQRVVHRHGGRVWAEASVNFGATFWFTLGSVSA